VVQLRVFAFKLQVSVLDVESKPLPKCKSAPNLKMLSATPTQHQAPHELTYISLALRNQGPSSASIPQNRATSAKKQDMRRLTSLIHAFFAEKNTSAENLLYIYRIICGE
jgi:hypothetical protein